MGLTIITIGDLTIPDVDMTYEKIIMRDNPGNYYYGKTDKKVFNDYHTNGNHTRYVNKNEMGYVIIKLIFDDGG